MEWQKQQMEKMSQRERKIYENELGFQKALKMKYEEQVKQDKIKSD